MRTDPTKAQIVRIVSRIISRDLTLEGLMKRSSSLKKLSPKLQRKKFRFRLGTAKPKYWYNRKNHRSFVLTIFLMPNEKDKQQVIQHRRKLEPSPITTFPTFFPTMNYVTPHGMEKYNPSGGVSKRPIAFGRIRVDIDSNGKIHLLLHPFQNIYPQTATKLIEQYSVAKRIANVVLENWNKCGIGKHLSSEYIQESKNY